jgi:hypothetical protein
MTASKLGEILANDEPLLEPMSREAGRVHEAARLRRRPITALWSGLIP